MINIDLSGQHILITGALGGIAEYVVTRLSEAGATVIRTDLKPKDEVEGDNYFSMDVTDASQVRSVVDTIFDRYPRIDVALGHAGGTGIFPFLGTPLEKFEEIVRFNFLGQAYFAHAVLSQWTQRAVAGHLIFTSSFVSRLPMAGISAYTSSKAGLEMLMKNLALEVAGSGIRVNAIAPGNVAVGSSMALYETDQEYRAWVDRVSPLGKRNSPAAIADTFLFLCSPLAREYDGQVLQVDMGVGLPKLG